MEETKQPIQMNEAEEQNPQLGNKVPNTFEELDEMRKNQDTLNQNNFYKTHTNFSYHGNNMMNPCPYKQMDDALYRFEKSMNLPKHTSTIRMPKSVDKVKYKIPESEYIWDAPYLKKTQIFPSYVSE